MGFIAENRKQKSYLPESTFPQMNLIFSNHRKLDLAYTEQRHTKEQGSFIKQQVLRNKEKVLAVRSRYYVEHAPIRVNLQSAPFPIEA